MAGLALLGCGALALLAALVPGERATAGVPTRGDVTGHVTSASTSTSPSPGHDTSPPAGHESSQGFILGAQAASDGPSSTCPARAPVRRYGVVAIGVDITVNRYLDHDPQGRMYALEGDIPRIRAEEARNADARRGHGDPAVTTGLQGDAIQPLTLRVHPGECLVLHLSDRLPGAEAAGIHLHGAGLTVAGDAGPAVATNPRAVARPGQEVTYEWMVGGDEPEGTHYFHSHGNDRFQADHGLFGAVIVEPAGSTWLDPATGRDDGGTGWASMVRPPSGPAFREFALYYHEVGDENYFLRNRNDQFVPQVDPITHAYRPDSRDLNYRSEPFMNRLALGQQVTGRADLSLEYSSYAFGDPATPIMRSYLGDPVKQRVIHAGGEVLHVHHVHGGGDRWLRQPDTQPSDFATGLDKHPALHPRFSERTDSQTIGPSETFDIADECGSGGCQQSAGDFMYHCHVTEHYFAGMWGIWRVYNTLQDGPASTDELAPLQELPERAGTTRAGVTSDALAGQTVSLYGQATNIPTDVGPWVERQLPPPGTPRGYDASVLDWRREGNLYTGEPETAAVWPNYRASVPGRRPPLLFDPASGRLAYPMLRPHLAQRPPFAPGHGPAPFLDPHSGPDPPAPGAGPASVCPAGTHREQLDINAIQVPVTLSAHADLVDPTGELFVLRQQEDAVRASNSLRTPLAVRSNAGESCVDVLLRSELTDNGNDPFSKVSAHIHFVQFDVQGSDGVDTGFNYEQTVRPYRSEGTALAAAAPAGATSIEVADPARFAPGALVGVGVDQDASFEARTVLAAGPGRLTLSGPLGFAHSPGEVVSTEFVRYRWYPDTQFGTAFFHDHTNVLDSGRHGLFGSLIAEPPGSSYTDPHTGAPLVSGEIADIHSVAPLSTDVTGSFRELALFLQDDNPITHVRRSSGGSIGLRVEPPEARSRDPSMLFSSVGPGDPGTPLLEANLGDPIALRTLVGASNDTHTLHVDGHWFRLEPWSPTSTPVSTVNVGISERYDLVIPSAGGPQAMAGDYLYYAGRSSKLEEGGWGIIRVHDRSEAGAIQPLPGHESVPRSAPSVCPPGSPRREYGVAAIEARLPMLRRHPGRMYVLEGDRALVLSGRRAPEPLVLHANVGDCLAVTLTNRTASGPVSFHADLLGVDPTASAGVAAGRDPDQSVAPGRSRTYTLYADPRVGETVALVRDWGDILTNPRLGLYGAIVVGPRGARYTDPATGTDISRGAGWRVDVHPPSGPAYRDASLFLEDEDAGIGTHRMPYTSVVEGVVGLNYRAAPLSERLAENPDPARVFDSSVHGDPPTPLLEAYAGDPVSVHVLAPSSEQTQVFSIENHRWPTESGRPGTTVVSSQHLGGLQVLSLRLEGGAQRPGDYLYGDHRLPYQQAGLWGLFRVRPCGGDTAGLMPLEGSCLPRGGGWARLALALLLVPALVLLGLGALLHRRSGRWLRLPVPRSRAAP